MSATTTKRIVKAGFINFWRNATVSLASLLVLSVTLFTIGGLMLGGAVLEASLNAIREKVDINVYFKIEAPENRILTLRDSVVGLPEVERVDYVSREQALTAFRERHEDNTLIIGALEELDDNPLGASLNIKAREPSQYESIARFLDADIRLSGEDSIIDTINFADNKLVIDRLTVIIDSVETLGLAVAALFILLAIMVTFNTIRLAIYASREEIAVMKLVGASNNYIRGPFIVEGLMLGGISSLIATASFYPITVWVRNLVGSFFGSIDIASYYLDNIFSFFGILLLSGFVLGALSSILAMRRYLDI